MASGTRARILAGRTGSLIVDSSVISGADIFTSVNAGSLISALVASGSRIVTFSETGKVVSELVPSAADVFIADRTGTIISSLVASGTRSREQEFCTIISGSGAFGFSGAFAVQIVELFGTMLGRIWIATFMQPVTAELHKYLLANDHVEITLAAELTERRTSGDITSQGELKSFL